jgi:hypothetical protein
MSNLNTCVAPWFTTESGGRYSQQYVNLGEMRGRSGTTGAAPPPQEVSEGSSRHWDSPPKRPKFPVIQLTVSLHLAIRHPLEVRSNRFV